MRLLPTSIPKLACCFNSLVCFLVAVEVSEGGGFAVIGPGIVGVKADSLLKGCERFSIVTKIIEDSAFAVVCVGAVGVKADDLLISCQRFFVTFGVSVGGACVKPIVYGFIGDDQIFGFIRDDQVS